MIHTFLPFLGIRNDNQHTRHHLTSADLQRCTFPKKVSLLSSHLSESVSTFIVGGKSSKKINIVSK